MSTIQSKGRVRGRGRERSKGKVKVISLRKLSGLIKAKGHPLPPSPSYLDIWIIKKALSDDSLMMELFKEWMRDHDRSYPTKEEEEKRFRVFKDHAQEVFDGYDERGKIWGMNGFADMSGAEFVATYLSKRITYDSGSDLDG